MKTIVDGAHAFAHFPYKAADLGCDYYGTSLHKWLLAPIGTGFLYVRRENIESLWALTADRGVARARTSASSRRSARTRRRTTTRSPRRSASTTASGSSARPRACATCATAGRTGCSRPAASRSTRSMDPAQSCAIGTVQVLGVRPARRCAAVGQVADHRDADRPRGVRRHPRHAERLHDARRDRHVRECDGEGGHGFLGPDRAERKAGARPRPFSSRLTYSLSLLTGSA